MAEPLLRPWTVDDFLAWEAQQEEPYEFIDGRILGMVEGTNAHALIKGNLYVVLRSKLRGRPCQPVIDGPKIVTGSGLLLSRRHRHVRAGRSGRRSDRYPRRHRRGPLEDDRRERPGGEVDRPSGHREPAALCHGLAVRTPGRAHHAPCEGLAPRNYSPPEASVELSAIKTTLSLDEIYENSGS